MTEAQAALESLSMYFNTLMLLAKVVTACVILDSVCFVTTWLMLCVSRMRPN
jgi:hypothetical protein